MIECVLNYTLTYARKWEQNWTMSTGTIVLKSVETSPEGEVTILWNPQVQTDRTIANHHNPW
jgi:hypothetical protein